MGERLRNIGTRVWRTVAAGLLVFSGSPAIGVEFSQGDLAASSETRAAVTRIKFPEPITITVAQSEHKCFTWLREPNGTYTRQVVTLPRTHKLYSMDFGTTVAPGITLQASFASSKGWSEGLLPVAMIAGSIQGYAEKDPMFRQLLEQHGITKEFLDQKALEGTRIRQGNAALH